MDGEKPKGKPHGTPQIIGGWIPAGVPVGRRFLQAARLLATSAAPDAGRETGPRAPLGLRDVIVVHRGSYGCFMLFLCDPIWFL